jgi:hypothetical protein
MIAMEDRRHILGRLVSSWDLPLNEALVEAKQLLKRRCEVVLDNVCIDQNSGSTITVLRTLTSLYVVYMPTDVSDGFIKEEDELIELRNITKKQYKRIVDGITL